MTLLSVKSIRKHFGPEPVLDGVTFDVRAGERLSLIGPNGTGKTTLLKILAGLEDADAGTTELVTGARVGFLEQHPEFVAGRNVWDEARDALRGLLELGEEAEDLARTISLTEDETERRRLGQRFDYLQQQLQHHGGYHVDHRIERVLQGLGFGPATYAQPVAQLSGGQKNRLILARLLLEDPDLLLLDEPSNHLDLVATQWLEDFLIECRRAVIVVSHDRYFLDRVTQRTLELFRGTVDSYPGNYSAYQRQKAERLDVQRRTYEKQRDEIAKMEDFIRRNHYGQKHQQAEDRRKKLERIELVSPPREIAVPLMAFPEPDRSGDIVIRAEHLSKAYAQPLFADLTFDVLRGEKWGILAPTARARPRSSAACWDRKLRMPAAASWARA